MAENKKVVITLGLNKMHASVEKYETETIKGMINAVRHLVKVEDK